MRDYVDAKYGNQTAKNNNQSQSDYHYNIFDTSSPLVNNKYPVACDTVGPKSPADVVLLSDAYAEQAHLKERWITLNGQKGRYKRIIHSYYDGHVAYGPRYFNQY
jgi:hypothetical protein